MGGSASPPAASPTQRPVPPPIASPSSSTVPFSWEQQPGIPKSCDQHKDQNKDVGAKVSFLPLPPPQAPIGSSSFRITPTSNKDRHAAIGSGCRKIKQQQVHLTKLFPVTDSHNQTQKATVKSGHDDPFSLALARCAEEARRPNSAPFRLPSPPSTTRRRRASSTASRWGSSKAKTNSGGSTARLSSAFRPLELYGSCISSNAGSCRSSVVDSTVTVPRRSSTSVSGYGRQNRQYVAYTILYGRHG